MTLLFERTKSILIWTRLLNGPFWGMVVVLPIILYKNLHATPLQIAFLLAIKPTSALFATYWSQMIHRRPCSCRKNLIIANVLRYFPFLFIPWIHSTWIILVIFGLYMALHRGVIPAWMEIIKVNSPPSAQVFLVGHGTLLDHLLGACFPVLLGVVLDDYEGAWPWIFFLTALCGLVSTVFLYRLPRVVMDGMPLQVARKDNLVVKPWKDFFLLLKKRPDFLNFQIGFMLGGSGLMILQPALPVFFVDILHLSYTNFSFAITVCKGIGFVFTTPFWVNLFRHINIYFFSAIVVAIASLFPFFLFAAQLHIVFLYLAFTIYGIMQAGSDLSWHMSGSVFSQEVSSTLFSEANILAVGIRGSVMPLIGAFLCAYSNATVIMMMGSFFCFIAAYHFMRHHFLTCRASKL
jgi:MFS family permease